MTNKFTKVPNCFLDNLQDYSDIEIRTFLKILRQTSGWQKKKDRIANSQFASAGISVNSMKKARKQLKEKGLIDFRTTSANYDYEYDISPIDISNSDTYQPVIPLSLSPSDTPTISSRDTVSAKRVSSGDTTKEIYKETKKEKEIEEKEKKQEEGKVLNNNINGINIVKEENKIEDYSSSASLKEQSEAEPVTEETEEEKAFRLRALDYNKNLQEAKATLQVAYKNNNEFQEPKAGVEEIYEEIEEVLNEPDTEYEEEDYNEFQGDVDSQSLLWRSEPTLMDEMLNQ